MRPVLTATMAAGGVACAVIGWVADPRRRSRVAVHWIAAALATVPTVTSLTSLVAHNEPFHTVNLILTLIGATALIHVRRAAVVVASLIIGGWAGVGLLLAPGAVNAATISAMSMAAVLGVILHLSRQRTVARLEAARAEIAVMAVSDELTKLNNRRALLVAGARVVTAAQRTGKDVTVLYLDVDGLKAVNDTQGHAAGDALILSVAHVLSSVFATADVLARTGGDEFAVVLSGYGPQETEMLRVRLAAALRQVGASASCGAAYLAAGDRDVTLEQLLDRADLAMYTEKASRRPAADRRDGERRAGLAAS
jgi:diguanylate cyclase (GGDEF)-like protein